MRRETGSIDRVGSGGESGSSLDKTTPKTRQGGGMTLQRLEDLLSDIGWQPDWRRDADRCDDYYDGHQLTAERKERMEALGIPPLITNLIAPVINSILGLEVRGRTDTRISEADEAQEAPEELIEALNVRQNEAERESRSDSAISEAYASMCKGGVGWVEVGRESDPMLYPYRVQAVNRNEIWWDMRSQRLDLLDCRYLIRKKRYDKDVLMAVMPEHAKLIEYAIEERFGSWQADTEITWDTNMVGAAEAERTTEIDANDWRDGERKRATIYEVWYREVVCEDMVTLPNGKVIPFDRKDVMLAEAVRRNMVVVDRRVTSKVRVAFYLGPHRLYDLPSPYPHNYFPYVPFFGFREARSGIRYGLIRNMISPQDVVNSADAKMHWMLNAKRVVAASDSIDTRYNTWRQVMDQISSPNAVVLLDPAKPNSRFEVQTDFQLNEQQFQRRVQAAADIENAGGVFKAMLGKEGASTSGVGINSLIDQGTIMLSEFTDNYSHGRRLANELLFHLVKQDLIDKEVRVPIKKQGKKQIITLNQRVVDPNTGEQTIANDIKSIDFKVTLNDVPSTASWKQQQLMIMGEVVKWLPPQMQGMLVPAMILMSDIPDKEEISEALKKMLGVAEKLSDEEQAQVDQAQAQYQAEMAAIERQMAKANLDLLLKKVDNLEASNQKIDAERVTKLLEGMEKAMAAGQVVVMTPGVAPIADELLISAGFEDKAGAADTIIDQGQGAEVMTPPPGPPLNQPQPPAPVVDAQPGVAPGGPAEVANIPSPEVQPA